MLNQIPDVGAVAVKAGDGLGIKFTFRVDGAPQDMSGWTFTSQWRIRAGNDDAIDFTVDQSGAASGVIVLSLTGEQTRDMGRSGVFDVQGVRGSSDPQTFLTGSTAWSWDVTR